MTVTAVARPIDALLSEYSESHQNKINKSIHWIAVPSIYLSIMGLLWSIPVPAALAGLSWFNWAVPCAVLTLAYYVRLSLSLTVGMAVFTAFCFWILQNIAAAGLSVLGVSVGIFVVMWIFQFIGHHVEGKKPSFFKDLQFLLIGPAWVMGFLMRKVGINY